MNHSSHFLWLICPSDWLHIGNRCYYFSDESSTWPEAQNDGRARGGDMAVPENTDIIYNQKIIPNILAHFSYAPTSHCNTLCNSSYNRQTLLLGGLLLALSNMNFWETTKALVDKHKGETLYRMLNIAN